MVTKAYYEQDYFKVSGQHYYRNMPKSDVRIITVAVLLLASWFFHTIQNQKYMKAVKFLKHAVSNNLGLKSGGTKQTIALYNHAAELYEERIKQCKFLTNYLLSHGAYHILHTSTLFSFSYVCFCY